jgi:hypothetical protein
MSTSKPDDIQLKIKDRLINNIRPSIMGLFDIDTIMNGGKTVVVVRLAGGMERPYYIKQKGELCSKVVFSVRQRSWIFRLF